MSFGDRQEQIAGREVKGTMKPVLDGEPSYEDIPQGLHDFSAPRWQDYDVRRYAYWSVFAGSCGHTYGHNSIMQFMRPGVLGSFGAEKAWWDAMRDPGYLQMKYLKQLMLSVPFTEGRWATSRSSQAPTASATTASSPHAATTTSWSITTAEDRCK
jgi:hypothetical protein